MNHHRPRIDKSARSTFLQLPRVEYREIEMALTSPFWSGNRRLQNASNNAPSMHPHDPDAVAVRLLQDALKKTGFFPTLKAPTGFYGNETAAAVRDVESTFALAVDQGVAGRQVLGVLDLLLEGKRPPTGGRSGASLAEEDKPLASAKTEAALAALREFRRTLVLSADASVEFPR